MGYIVSRDSLKFGYRQSRKQQKFTVKREEKNTVYRFRTLFNPTFFYHLLIFPPPPPI